MSPRFWRWVAGLSWAFVGLVAAIAAVNIALGATAPPAWSPPLMAVAWLVALPLGIWSPVFLVFSHARSRQALRQPALGGLTLASVSLGLTLVVLTDGNTYMPSNLWRVLSRGSLPVMLITLAVAWYTMAALTPAGPRAKRLLASGVAAMFVLAVTVTGMIIVDSGNRTMFSLLALLLAWSVIQLPMMFVLRRRARRVVAAVD